MHEAQIFVINKSISNGKSVIANTTVSKLSANSVSDNLLFCRIYIHT